MDNKLYDVIIPCNDLDTAQIVVAEIKAKLGYYANIQEYKRIEA